VFFGVISGCRREVCEELRSSGLCVIIPQWAVPFSSFVFFLTHSTKFVTEDTPNSSIELFSSILANDARWYGTGTARRWTISGWLPNEGGIQNGCGWYETAFYLNHGHSFLEHMVPNVLTLTHCEWRCFYSKPSVIRPNWEGRGKSGRGSRYTSGFRGPLPSLLPRLKMRF